MTHEPKYGTHGFQARRVALTSGVICRGNILQCFRQTAQAEECDCTVGEKPFFFASREFGIVGGNGLLIFMRGNQMPAWVIRLAVLRHDRRDPLSTLGSEWTCSSLG